jgi:hypothetical protein
VVKERRQPPKLADPPVFVCSAQAAEVTYTLQETSRTRLVTPTEHHTHTIPPQAWDLYYHVFKRINKQLHSLTTLELQYVAPALVRAQVRRTTGCCGGWGVLRLRRECAGGWVGTTCLQNLDQPPTDRPTANRQPTNQQGMELAVPGTYIAGEPLVTIAAFAPQLQVISSKQRPRKLTIHGGDGAEYMFLLKGHEDLRQDERVMQLFGLVNSMLAAGEERRAVSHAHITPCITASGCRAHAHIHTT